MPSLLNFLPNAASQSHAQIVYAEVTTPAPTSFTDPLYVVTPDWSVDIPFTITDWPAVHGLTLPLAGDTALLITDNRGLIRCVWWDGQMTYSTQTSLAYYLTPTASDIGGYLQQLPTPYSPKTTVSLGTINNLQVLENYVTQPNVPALTFIPAGQFEFHIHAIQTAGNQTVQLFAEFWEFIGNYANGGVSSVTNNNSFGSVPWTNPANAGALDGAVATSSNPNPSSNFASQRLHAVGYGFAIPGGAVITGIQVNVTRFANVNTGTEHVQDLQVRLVKAGVLQNLTDRAATGVNWPTNSTLATYGGASDLWGTTWTPADINNALSGVSIMASMTRVAGTSTASIDAVQMTVFYTLGGNPLGMNMIGQTQNSQPLTSSEVEYRLFFTTANVYTLASTSSRILCRLKALVGGTGGAAAQLFVGGMADSHVIIPTVTNAPLTTSAWIAPTLLNSWANQGGTFETAGYLKDALGFVHLKGVVTGGATTTIAFVLPAGYRPGAQTMHAGGNADVVGSAPTAVRVDTSGGVLIQCGSNNSFVGLSGITFLAEN